jgi:hypothetical protein
MPQLEFNVLCSFREIPSHVIRTHVQSGDTVTSALRFDDHKRPALQYRLRVGLTTENQKQLKQKPNQSSRNGRHHHRRFRMGSSFTCQFPKLLRSDPGACLTLITRHFGPRRNLCPRPHGPLMHWSDSGVVYKIKILSEIEEIVQPALFPHTVLRMCLFSPIAPTDSAANVFPQSKHVTSHASAPGLFFHQSIGTGSFTSRFSSRTEARTRTILFAAVPLPYGLVIPRSFRRKAGFSVRFRTR